MMGFWAKLAFDQINQSYHVDSQRQRIDLANREQELTILQSNLVSFSVSALQFRTVDGTMLTIKAVLRPDAVVVSNVGGSRPLKLVPRPASR